MKKEELLDQLAIEMLRLAPHLLVKTYEVYDLAKAMVDRRQHIIDQWTLRDANTGGLIEALGLSVRAVKCLEADEIYTIDQLIYYSENDLLRLPNLGRRSLNEIKEKLAERGLKLRGQA
jgi:DNA-directed RNA polymerase alpha subunit